MKLTFIFIGLIGIILLVNSIRILINSRKKNKISEFNLDSEEKIVELNSTGLYSICFIGAGFVGNKGSFTAELQSENGSHVELNKTFPNYRFYHNGTLGLEYWNLELLHLTGQ